MENKKPKYGQQIISDWAKNNRTYLNNKFNERIKTYFNFKMKKTCQRHLLLNLNKKMSTMKYFSCSVELFTKWLEFCFTGDMNIDNHGTKWHLDHVIPVSLFDLNKETERFLCFHYLNYMPLYAEDNIRKQNKIIYSQIIKHIDNIIEFFELLARHLIMPGISLEF